MCLTLQFVVFLLTWSRIANVAFSFYVENPVDFDEAHWAGKTCAYELKPSDELRLKWRDFQLENGNNVTKCYVKCSLHYTGMYNSNTKTINTTAIKEQFVGLGYPIPKGLETLKVSTDGSCSDIYDKTIALITRNKKDFRRVFWSIESDVKEWYQKMGNKIKPFGMKPSQYCKEKFTSNRCKRLDCMYRYYRLIDRAHKTITDRNMDPYEIDQDKLRDCQMEADQKAGCMVSRVLKKCMEAEDKATWSKLIDFLDNVSAKYEYD
uniref:D7-related protein n=1 Tax=Sergentomyia schwetzi TaxID=114605 RepID=A0A6B9VJR7_9DIPT|nr:D7-related protein [Sergentomyia schwetzi]